MSAKQRDGIEGQKLCCRECGEWKALEEFDLVQTKLGTSSPELGMFSVTPVIPSACRECAGEEPSRED